MLQLAGMAIDPAAILPVWDPSATVQPKSEAEIRKLATEAGIPLEIQLQREGWSEDDIAALKKVLEADRAASERSLANALVTQQRNFDRGQGQTTDSSQQQGANDQQPEASNS
jgi:hypothetical protein